MMRWSHRLLCFCAIFLLSFFLLSLFFSYAWQNPKSQIRNLKLAVYCCVRRNFPIVVSGVGIYWCIFGGSIFRVWGVLIRANSSGVAFLIFILSSLQLALAQIGWKKGFTRRFRTIAIPHSHPTLFCRRFGYFLSFYFLPFFISFFPFLFV